MGNSVFILYQDAYQSKAYTIIFESFRKATLSDNRELRGKAVRIYNMIYQGICLFRILLDSRNWKLNYPSIVIVSYHLLVGFGCMYL